MDNSEIEEGGHRQSTVFDIPDLTNLIADYCDEESLSKLSRVHPLYLIIAGQQRCEKDDL